MRNFLTGLALITGLLLAGAEHSLDASNWCWLINLSGLGILCLVAATTQE